MKLVPPELLRKLAVIGAIGAISISAHPARLSAQQLETDIICGADNAHIERDAKDRPDIMAKQAIVVDSEGTVYFERGADQEVKIASITKVMTAILTLEHANLADEITVDHRAATVGQSSAELEEGDVLTVEEALRGLMIPSGNDAAMALASFVGAKIDPKSDDPYRTFIDAMNAKAAELDMDHTVFDNPHGLDFDGWEGDFHSTARDVATMFAYAMKNDSFRAITISPDNVIEVMGRDGTGRSIEMIERNLILGEHGNIGGKTGGTDDAGSCFAGAFSRDQGGEVYTVTLGNEDDEQRWTDTLALADWYYGHWTAYPLGKSSRTCADGRPLIALAPHADWTDKSVDLTIENPDQMIRLFSLNGDVELKASFDKLSGDVREGDHAGTLTLIQDGSELASAGLVACENQDAPAPLEWIMVKLDRLARFFTGRPATTQEEVVAQAIDPLTLDSIE